MAKSKSSGRWLEEHVNDPFVKQSQKEGYRSRASYKLIEIDKKDRLLKSGMSVVDLGAAPGGWAQVAARRVGEHGRVIASDILPMDSLADVAFIQGDFTEESVYQRVLATLEGREVDLVISDMAPNMSGVAAVDQPSSMYLVELALEFAQKSLRRGGCFVAKVFQGEGSDAFVKECRVVFDRVVIRKPQASRPRSREVYLVAKGFKH